MNHQVPSIRGGSRQQQRQREHPSDFHPQILNLNPNLQKNNNNQVFLRVTNHTGQVRHSDKHLIIIILYPSSLSHHNHLNLTKKCFYLRFPSLKIDIFSFSVSIKLFELIKDSDLMFSFSVRLLLYMLHLFYMHVYFDFI